MNSFVIQWPDWQSSVLMNCMDTFFFSPEETNSTTTSPGDGQETVTRSRGHGQRHSHRQGHRHGV